MVYTSISQLFEKVHVLFLCDDCKLERKSRNGLEFEMFALPLRRVCFFLQTSPSMPSVNAVAIDTTIDMNGKTVETSSIQFKPPQFRPDHVERPGILDMDIADPGVLLARA